MVTCMQSDCVADCGHVVTVTQNVLALSGIAPQNGCMYIQSEKLIMGVEVLAVNAP